jgi:hypothetical protein
MLAQTSVNETSGMLFSPCLATLLLACIKWKATKGYSIVASRKTDSLETCRRQFQNGRSSIEVKSHLPTPLP